MINEISWESYDNVNLMEAHHIICDAIHSLGVKLDRDRIDKLMYETMIKVIPYVDPIPTFGERREWRELNDEEKVILWAKTNGGINEKRVCELLYILRSQEASKHLFAMNILSILPQEVTYAVLERLKEKDLKNLRLVDKQTQAIADMYTQDVMMENNKRFDVVSKSFLSLLALAYDLGIYTRSSLTFHCITQSGYPMILRVELSALVGDVFDRKETSSLKAEGKYSEWNGKIDATVHVLYHPDDKLAEKKVTQVSDTVVRNWILVSTGPVQHGSSTMGQFTKWFTGTQMKHIKNRGTQPGTFVSAYGKTLPIGIAIRPNENEYHGITKTISVCKLIVRAMMSIANLGYQPISTDEVFITVDIQLQKLPNKKNKDNITLEEVTTYTPLVGAKYVKRASSSTIEKIKNSDFNVVISGEDKIEVMNYIFRMMAKDPFSIQDIFFEGEDKGKVVDNFVIEYAERKKAGEKKFAHIPTNIHESVSKKQKGEKNIVQHIALMDRILHSKGEERLEYAFFLDAVYCDLRYYNDITAAMKRVIGNSPFDSVSLLTDEEFVASKAPL
jgi:hypothetical protein